MSQTERRHERLAVRLSLIISRLVAGETLDMGLLAAEFGVSIRTLRRDFRERLMYLDLEYRDGTCRLLSGNHVQVHSREVVKSALRFNAAAVVLAHISTASRFTTTDSPAKPTHSAPVAMSTLLSILSRLSRSKSPLIP
ncbi:hypothetical protein CRM76_07675 [Edwardsiella tarda]|uniref:RadC-like JAB domain-containing protein n=1 Tax=Edwardsiella tarda TaxID=636 RepID=A0A2A7U094_EDWTA|nr:hypothetical protein CRM76_07675 [Edwardsiella tarda]